MYKYLLRSSIVYAILLIISIKITAQVTTVKLNNSFGTWNPPIGCDSFYVELWGGGAGGNTGAGTGNLPTGGGGGGSYAKTAYFAVTPTTFANGYSYSIGAGGGIGSNGGATWFSSNINYKAPGGLTRNTTQQKSPINSFIITSFYGGGGGSSYRLGPTWQGGGGASGRRTGDGYVGGNADYNYTGGGAEGGAYNDGDNTVGRGGKDGSYFPGIPGGGGAGNQEGSGGIIIISYTCKYNPGIIGYAHTVPSPAELGPFIDLLANVKSPVIIGNYSLKWEGSKDGITYESLGMGTGLASFVQSSITQDIYYRRTIANGCGTNNSTPPVLIKVFSQGNFKKNGIISGKVTSIRGVGVLGVTVTAKKTINLKGSPQSFEYKTTITKSDGSYTLGPIFYGDNSAEGGDPDEVFFKIVASMAGHIISSLDPVPLTNIIPKSENNNFTDSTVYAITGRITQTDNTCLPGSRGPFGIGNVKISADDQNVFPVNTDSLRKDSLGYYGITVTDPKKYRFTPEYLNHTFSPAFKDSSITADVDNINFNDITTKIISGKLTDAAGLKIGSGTLLFEGFYLRKDSTPVPTFKKTADIAPGDGGYSVTLPAGFYKVTVQSFTSAYASNNDSSVTQNEVKEFFNVLAGQPLIDINTRDTIINLIYHRPPVVIINGLYDEKCNQDSILNPGIVFRTNAKKPFQVYIFEGLPSLKYQVQVTPANNKADTVADYIRFNTNITARDADANPDDIYFRLKNVGPAKPMLDSFFLPGVPNDVAINKGDYSKPFEMRYTDRYGREAKRWKPKVTVVGILNPTSTFTTAFPEVPFLILHAPPGDGSYSFWSKDSITQLSTSVSVASEQGRDGFVNVSLAPTVSLSSGAPGAEIGFELQGIATLNYTKEYSVNSGSTDELVQTAKATQRYETVKNPIKSQNSGDVYIGNGTNYILGKSISVDFVVNKPPNACEIDTSSRLIMAPKGFRTEFAYSEDQIVNKIIPQQITLRDQATDDSIRAMAQSQIDVWQQVIENNNRNKKNAAFIANRSFSFGVKIDQEETITKASTNTIVYDVVVGNNFVAELGFRSVGIGVSGGAVITMRETTGRSNVVSKEKAVTIGYHLEDDDPGDYYSVDVKKDSVYGTPVFNLLAGANSCPPENGAQKRDLPQILSGDATFNNWDPNKENFFDIILTNKSESGESRRYNLSVDGNSAQDLQITANGTVNLVGFSTSYKIDYGKTQKVQIGVKKVNQEDKRFSFQDVEFSLSDNCQLDNLFDPNIENTAKYTFNFTSSCGSIAMDAPLDGWVVNSAGSNSVPITISGYTLSNIDSITLQYSKIVSKGSKDWQNGFTVKKAAISNPTSFTVPWNVALLKDTVYNLRLMMVCDNQNILYSPEVVGVVDRKAPSILGSPQPVSRLYNPAVDQISFSYNESINTSNLNQGAAELVRRSNNAVIPISVNEDNGKIVITPLVDLGNTADSFRVIVKNITDLFGNIRTKPDTSYFKLDFTQLITYTGSNVAKVYITPPAIAENSTGKMELHFKLKEKTTKVTKVYFNLFGTALNNTDYKISYDTISRKVLIKVRCNPSVLSDTSQCDSLINDKIINQFSSSGGFVNIDSDKTEAIIYIDPTEDTEVEGGESIIINLINGPDYKLVDSVTATGTILNSGLPCPPANILYVNEKATGNNTGVSWVNAMRSLKEAINRTCPNVTQIWVAKGTYKPTTNTSRDSSFVMKNNLAIYGGFAGTETQLTQRNIRINPTILSGDIGMANSNTDNSYNIVRNISNGLNSTAILDGFIVTGGKGNGAGFGSYGAGIINVNSTPSFYNCSIIVNSADAYGGGMYNNGTAPIVVNSIFAGNTALYGGGLYNEDAATKLINCSFSGNIAFAEGGAISTFGAVVPQITNSILWGNSSGIRNAGGSAPAITYSIVQGGYTGMGNLNTDPLFILQPAPGLANVGDLRLQGCSPVINAGNNAALPGGISLDLAAFPRVVNTTIDMGAYERQSSVLSTIIYVDINATGNNSGESWANAYTNLGSAITELNFCGAGTTILIAKGTYFAPVNDTYNLDKLNASMLGGYPSGGGISRDAEANPVIIRGNVQVLKSVKIDGVRVQKQ